MGSGGSVVRPRQPETRGCFFPLNIYFLKVPLSTEWEVVSLLRVKPPSYTEVPVSVRRVGTRVTLDRVRVSGDDSGH